MPAAERLSHAVLEQAAHWYAQLRAADVADSDYAAWRTWLDHHPAHAEAWAYVERISARFSPLQQDGERDRAFELLRPQRARPVSRRQLLVSMGVLSAAGLCGMSFSGRSDYLADAFDRLGADYTAGVGEIKAFSLADGSRGWLASNSAVDAGFAAGCTTLTLRCGEVYWQTAATTQARLELGVATVYVQGATLSAQRQGNQSRVRLVSGVARVVSTAGSASATLTAGQEVLIDNRIIGTPQAFLPGADAWIKGLLIVDGVPLQSVLRELGRYTHAHLGHAPEVANIRVVGSFPLQNLERSLTMLQQALPVSVNRVLPWWINVQQPV
ncbi:DUF4880 domain-containing protein [Pseudomonas sp. NPDC090202]|uniref:DUF4880 domain-containing protein n=1 Tax=unclassified Pseudomonas TaxID=196821 RepID=UPI00381EBFB0